MKLRELFFAFLLVMACAVAPVLAKPVALIDPNVELANPVVISQGRINISGTWCRAVHVTGKNEAHYLVVLDNDGDPLFVFAILDPTQAIENKNMVLVWSAVDLEDGKEI